MTDPVRVLFAVADTNQRNVARAIGVHESEVSRDLHGHKALTPEKRARMIAVLIDAVLAPQSSVLGRTPR